ncbi:ABC transporter permease [Azospirillum canadense]|uniref:ABC transporter permease n=1 Tax=Azospirillum canadense TaxID=403962 RepID=UPI002227D037|nr:ABC transporter permease [Azospirillum canadense]MCW2244274.1 peptide/nickel transport system permease protein [Azospirillum canadense]
MSAAREESPLRRLARDFARSRVAVVGLAVLVLVMLAAVFAQLVAPQDPYDLAQLDIMDSLQPPGTAGGAGWTYWLGTDDQGRDLWSAIVFGLRTSLEVGILATLIALAVGVAVGMLAAYAGGAVDGAIMRLVDIQLSFPAILIALILLALLGKGVDKVIVALAAVQWAYYARTVRGSALVERRKEYVEAARCLALPHSRIMLRHLLPNCLPPLIVVATVQVAHAIALEATLSFLGVGVPVTEPSLGMLIASGYGFMLSGNYWVSLFPGVALLVVIVAINLVGDRLRDVLNPRLSH